MFPKYIRNMGKEWTRAEKNALVQLAKKNTPTRVIGLLLGRPENSIYSMASQLGVNLKPANQSSYNKVKK
ncbi:hypothetical protein HZB04_03990 [Candidatus Wolfebacteria bacterium]|nr:hypothetical protein [Candidatus Wolfebacteria bacterium]